MQSGGGGGGTMARRLVQKSKIVELSNYNTLTT